MGLLVHNGLFHLIQKLELHLQGQYIDWIEDALSV